MLPIVDHEADRLYRGRTAELRPGGLAKILTETDHQWKNTRPLLRSNIFPTPGKALEFGCAFGASATMLALMGWQVTGVDVNPNRVELSRLNALRYGASGEFLHVPDTRHLPFPDQGFDLICANSVLEYIYPRSLLPEIFRGMDRVLRPGGILFVGGTSNRLLPREQHCGRWFVNYVPEWLDPILGRHQPQRGLWPWQIRGAFPGYVDLLREDNDHVLIKTKQDVGWSGSRMAVLKLLHVVAQLAGTSMGAFLPSICYVLRKPGETVHSAESQVLTRAS